MDHLGLEDSWYRHRWKGRSLPQLDLVGGFFFSFFLVFFFFFFVHQNHFCQGLQQGSKLTMDHLGLEDSWFRHRWKGRSLPRLSRAELPPFTKAWPYRPALCRDSSGSCTGLSVRRKCRARERAHSVCQVPVQQERGGMLCSVWGLGCLESGMTWTGFFWVLEGHSCVGSCRSLCSVGREVQVQRVRAVNWHCTRYVFRLIRKEARHAC